MTATSPTEPPTYPHCGSGADADDSIGCRGRLVPNPLVGGDEAGPALYDACLAHLNDGARDVYLASLRPGSALDHRGTTFSASLLGLLLDAVRDSADQKPRLGAVTFSGATFTSEVNFEGATFEGVAYFDGSTFQDVAVFSEATFEDAALFQVTFEVSAYFGGAVFQDFALFSGAVFGGVAGFDQATFKGTTEFAHVAFTEGALFGAATFTEVAEFGGADFKGDATFKATRFKNAADFHGATFKGDATFVEVTFQDDARFFQAIFHQRATYVLSSFDGTAGFGGSTFEGDARFDGATFKGDIVLNVATFKGEARFDRALFELASQFGPLACQGTLTLTAAVFSTAVTLEIAASRVDCRRTRWASTAALRLRYARVDLSDAVLEYPVSITARPRPFMIVGQEMTEPGLADPRVRIESLRGVDAMHLVLADVDLTECRFAGTIHLDQVRLEGLYLLATTPPGLRRRGLRPVHWTPRRALAEEHHWRATRHGGAEGWTPPPDREEPLEPIALAPVYRQLRKAFEDSKHEPGAADFYYGEMEMRRYASDIPWVERALLTAYWALSGYGLRASRALGWLVAAMSATVLAMMLWGLPQDDPTPIGTGILTERRITMTTDTPDPVNPTGPLHDRLSAKRFEKSLRVVINSVVFRSSGQNLTTAGTYTEMTSRLVEPVLLGLAALAIRSRVKR